MLHTVAEESKDTNNLKKYRIVINKTSTSKYLGLIANKRNEIYFDKDEM